MSNNVAFFLGGIVFLFVMFGAFALESNGDNRVELAHIQAGHITCAIVGSKGELVWTKPELCIGLRPTQKIVKGEVNDS